MRVRRQWLLWMLLLPLPLPLGVVQLRRSSAALLLCGRLAEVLVARLQLGVGHNVRFFICVS